VPILRRAGVDEGGGGVSKSNMDLGDLYRHIRRCIAHIVVLDNNEIISDGTGFAFTRDGAILTAAHVVAGGFPVRPGEVDQASRQICVFFVDQDRQMLYLPMVCPFQIEGLGLPGPLQLDVAIIRPVEKPALDLTFLTASVEPPRLGEEMYFGGYSDEVEMPFLLDRQLPPNTLGLDVFKRAIETGIKARIAGPIIKRGTVGNIFEGCSVQNGCTVLKQTAFYLDNQIHYGASGGPIVSRNGTVRGIISKRMVTHVDDPDKENSKMMVPAGSTLGIGLDPLLALTAPSSS
jgi:Trypsin-like peptidase domain